MLVVVLLSFGYQNLIKPYVWLLWKVIVNLLFKQQLQNNPMKDLEQTQDYPKGQNAKVSLKGIIHFKQIDIDKRAW